MLIHGLAKLLSYEGKGIIKQSLLFAGPTHRLDYTICQFKTHKIILMVDSTCKYFKGEFNTKNPTI